MSASPATSNDPLARCPFCGSSNTDRHYLQLADGSTQPGCMDCEESRPMDQWAAAVLARATSSGTP